VAFPRIWIWPPSNVQRTWKLLHLDKSLCGQEFQTFTKYTFCSLFFSQVWYSNHENGYFQRSVGGEKSWGKRYFIQLRVMKEVDILIRDLTLRLRRLGITATAGYGRVIWSDLEKPLVLKVCRCCKNFATTIIFVCLFLETEPLDSEICVFFCYVMRRGQDTRHSWWKEESMIFHSTHFVSTFLWITVSKELNWWQYGVYIETSVLTLPLSVLIDLLLTAVSLGNTFYPSNSSSNNNNGILPTYYTIQEDRFSVGMWKCQILISIC
jgi:hypothetical protein